MAKKQSNERGMFASLFGAISASAQSVEGLALAVKAATVSANTLAWAGVAEANSVFAESLELSEVELKAEQDMVLALRGRDIAKLYHLELDIPPAPAQPAPAPPVQPT